MYRVLIVIIYAVSAILANQSDKWDENVRPKLVFDFIQEDPNNQSKLIYEFFQRGLGWRS